MWEGGANPKLGGAERGMAGGAGRDGRIDGSGRALGARLRGWVQYTVHQQEWDCGQFPGPEGHQCRPAIDPRPSTHSKPLSARDQVSVDF